MTRSNAPRAEPLAVEEEKIWATDLFWPVWLTDPPYDSFSTGFGTAPLKSLNSSDPTVCGPYYAYFHLPIASFAGGIIPFLPPTVYSENGVRIPSTDLIPGHAGPYNAPLLFSSPIQADQRYHKSLLESGVQAEIFSSMHLEQPYHLQHLPVILNSGSLELGQQRHDINQLAGYSNVSNQVLMMGNDLQDVGPDSLTNIVYEDLEEDIYGRTAPQETDATSDHGLAYSVPELQSQSPSPASSNEQVLPSRFACHYPSCNTTFGRRSDRDRHARKHDGARAYLCPKAHCSMRFYRNDKLQSHLQNGHPL